jgi:cytidine deaminase
MRTGHSSVAKKATEPRLLTLADEILRRLIAAARDASTRAYCTYSKFPVGAAVLSDSGAIYTGCNVENASFGLTICAERNAIFHAVASGDRRLRAVVVYTPTPAATTPCGACRQVIREFAGADALIISAGVFKPVQQWNLAQLLPMAYGPDTLERAPRPGKRTERR